MRESAWSNKKLTTAITEHPVLAAACHKNIVGLASAGSLTPGYVGVILVERCKQGLDAADAISELIAFVQKEEVDVLRVLCLHGVIASAAIRLEDNIRIIPPNDLPSVAPRDELFGTEGEDHFGGPLRHRARPQRSS